ncbi:MULTISPECIES: dienelactone hydrolase family protein [Frankia]|nr:MULTISPECIES: dienelactone hydrolase family protein [Frankia]
MSDALRAQTVSMRGAGDDDIEAYLAEPLDGSPAGGVVVIHHMPGYDESTKEITRRFAAHGYLAVCPNLYSREAPGASPGDAAALARARGGVPDDRLVGDVDAAVRLLRSSPSSNGKVAVIGFCSGGRQAFLAACSLDLDAAVDCYGAYVVATPPEDSVLRGVRPIVDLAGRLSCPLLGLFGDDDRMPSPAEVAALAAALTEHGRTFEFHSFPAAGHAFLATDRDAYRPAAARAAWPRIWTFLRAHLTG